MPLLQYYGSGGSLQNEPKIMGRLVDGLNPTDDTVIFFHGCLYHSCKNCYPPENLPHPFFENMTHSQVRQRDTVLQQLLVSAGYNVRVKYECQWEKDKKTLPAALEFVKSCSDVRLGKNRFDPQGQDRHLIKDESTLLDAVKRGSIFGFIACDVHHPEPRADNFFVDLPPIIKNVLVRIYIYIYI
jgi:G:T-mismatch repair DNA endonuclease (very short patch repair protein)